MNRNWTSDSTWTSFVNDSLVFLFWILKILNLAFSYSSLFLLYMLHAQLRRHLILSCQGRLNIFPFDDPLCSFSVESSKYERCTYNWMTIALTFKLSQERLFENRLLNFNDIVRSSPTVLCIIFIPLSNNNNCSRKRRKLLSRTFVLYK